MYDTNYTTLNLFETGTTDLLWKSL